MYIVYTVYYTYKYILGYLRPYPYMLIDDCIYHGNNNITEQKIFLNATKHLFILRQSLI